MFSRDIEYKKCKKKKKDPNWTSRNKNYNVWNKKNTLDGVNGRLDVTEEKISESEDIGRETIQTEMQREKDFKNDLNSIPLFLQHKEL